jgi:hypothetical protein
VLPPTLTKIGYCSFYGCYQLTKINIPKGLISIGKNGFESTDLFSEAGQIDIEEGSNFNLKEIMEISGWDKIKKRYFE